MEKEYFNKERRQANMEIVIKKLNEIEELDFNSLAFTFADIIQSSFMNGLYIGKTKEEREEVNQQITDLNNNLIDTLNDHSDNMMFDMIVLSNLIMDAVETAMQKALQDANS